MRERAERIALYIDLENFVGYCLSLGLPIDLAPELTRLTELGKVTIRRSFGDIYKLPITPDKKLELRRMLQNNLIQHEDIPHFNAFKNTSDIRLVIDVLSTAYTNEGIDMVAVVASDRDYLPLFAKLREIGKEIIGIGGNRDNTPELYVRACDYFFYHEILTGCAPQIGPQRAAEHAAEEPAEPVQPGGEEPSSESSGARGPQNEAVQLLIDALQALEAKGTSVHSGGSVIQMMRRLMSDFDLAGYGYDSFKQLCEQAAASGRITIEHSGVIFNLRLAAPHSSADTEEAPLPVGELVPQGPLCSHLREWLETKMRVPLPSAEERAQIYRELLRVLNGIDAEEGVKLTVLSEEVHAGLGAPPEFNSVCFKVLYSLYRSNCFTCSPGNTPYSPLIHHMREYDDPEALDARFIENNLRVYVRECRAPIDEEGWSEVFFGSGDHAELIRDIARML